MNECSLTLQYSLGEGCVEPIWSEPSRQQLKSLLWRIQHQPPLTGYKLVKLDWHLDWIKVGVFLCSAWSLLLAVHSRTLDGRLLCTVINQASTVSLALPDSHLTEVSLHIYHATQHPLILNYPWLVLHSPHIDWSTGTFSSWSELWTTLHLYLETVSSKTLPFLQANLWRPLSEFILSSEQ